jgi:hypothetical protein
MNEAILAQVVISQDVQFDDRKFGKRYYNYNNNDDHHIYTG